MTTSYQLPLVPSVAHYGFSTTLSGVPYNLELRWNARDAAWFMSVADENNEPIYSGIKIVLGALLGVQCTDARFPPGVFMAIDTTGEGRDATLDDLGTRVIVIYTPVSELVT